GARDLFDGKAANRLHVPNELERQVFGRQRPLADDLSCSLKQRSRIAVQVQRSGMSDYESTTATLRWQDVIITAVGDSQNVVHPLRIPVTELTLRNFGIRDDQRGTLDCSGLVPDGEPQPDGCRNTLGEAFHVAPGVTHVHHERNAVTLGEPP